METQLRTERLRPNPEWRRVQIRTAVLSAVCLAALALTARFGVIQAVHGGLELRPCFHGRDYHLIRWISIATVVAFLAFLCLPWTRRLAQRLSRTGGFRFLPGVVFLAGLCTGPLRNPGTWTALGIALAALAAVLYLFRGETARLIDWGFTAFRAGWLSALVLAVCGGVAVYALFHVVFYGETFCVDTAARLFHAHVLNQGRWYLPAPAHPEFYSREGVVVSAGRWYSQYFPGAILLTLAGLRIGSLVFVPALLAGGVAVLTYACGARLYSRRIGLLGAFFVVVSPLFLLQSSIQMEHTPTTFFLMAALYLALRDLDRPSYPNAVLWGLVLGYGCITRPLTCLGFAFPLTIVYLALTRRQWLRRLPFWAVAVAAWCVPVAFLLYFNFRTSGHALVPGYVLEGSTFHSLGFTARNGHTPLTGLYNELGNFDSLSEWLFMWPLTSYLFVLVLFVAGRSRWTDWVLLSSFAGLLTAYFFYPFHNICLGPRFVAEAIPPLALLTARGIAETIALAGRHSTPAATAAVRRALVALLLALTLGAIRPACRWFLSFHTVARPGVELARQLRAFRDDPKATVFFPSSGADHKALLEQVQCLGGAEFFIAGDSQKVRAYMAQYPERRYFLLNGPDFDNVVALDPAEQAWVKGPRRNQDTATKPEEGP